MILTVVASLLPQVDRFQFADVGVLGDLTKIRVRNDGHGAHPDWLLDSVVVTHAGESTTFACNEWLRKSEELIRELVPSAGRHGDHKTHMHLATKSYR